MTNYPRILTRKEAKRLGEKFYFTGKPCRYGHIYKRQVSNRGCQECISPKLTFVCSVCNEITTKVFRKDRSQELICRHCHEIAASKKRIEDGVSKTFGENCRKYDTDFVKSVFIERGATPLFDIYTGPHQKLAFSCSTSNCQNVGYIDFDHLYYRNYSVPKCPSCQFESRLRGENHPNWNPDLTDEEREKERGYNFIAWTKQVLRLANYTCNITGERGGKLAAHHLFNWANNPEKRFDLSNGVCISQDLHELFHSILYYGKKYNTLEQYLQFKQMVWGIS